MDLEHSFTVPVGVDEAWTILLDVERVAPCMPGASLETVDGDEFTGNVKVKLGAINLTYKGKASFVEKDEAAHRAVIDARGRDSRGNGTASAKVTTLLTDEGGSTKVLVQTELDITGKVAQFGRGVMVDVGNKLIGQFADCLAKTISAGNEAPAAESEAAATAKLTPARKTTSKAAKKATPAKKAAPASDAAPAEVSAPASEPAPAETSAPAAKRARPRPTKPASDESAANEPASASPTAPTGDAVDPTAQTLETPTAPEAPVPDEPALQAVSETPGYSAPAATAEEPTVEAPVSPVNGRTAAAAEREVEPIDLIEHAGPAIAKRAAPPAALLLLIVLYVILRRAQRD